MGAFFDSLKTSAKVGADEVKKTMRISQLQSEISQLEKKQNDIYAAIGRMAVEADGAEKFGDVGANLAELQEEAAVKKAELNELKPPVEASAESGDGFCPSCGTKYTAGTKFCGSCGGKLN
ncbi:MAG TPA: zinc-ribbon domain-containing protein [Methanocorpusculum sp.]|nr:hypothetical protein [Methanocorpusculum sp.]HKL98045.1 zinc-ribbon domain-containing protein [Methanocorpusculum sp.]